MTWHNRRAIGDGLNLQASLWARQAGVTRAQKMGLVVPARSSPAVRTTPERANIGNLGADRPGAKPAVLHAEFHVWSPTRDELPLEFKDKHDDGLFNIDAKPLDNKECAALQEKLRAQEVNTRVRSGYRVNVAVHEHKGGKWLDQGHFLRPIGLHLPDVAHDLPSLLVTGIVQGPIKIGGIEDQGKINLKSFPAKDGTRKTVLLWSDLKTKLEVIDKQPSALVVNLVESKEKLAKQKQWVLEVVVPPNQLFGPISDDSAVTLQADTVPPRQIRIPLAGHGVQG
jgi:hypothetical protein